jgi:rubredoxin
MRRRDTPGEGGARSSPSTETEVPSFKIWECALCGFRYDEAAGLPEEGLPPGTRWQDVPATWTCPDCGAGKDDFEMREAG